MEQVNCSLKTILKRNTVCTGIICRPLVSYPQCIAEKPILRDISPGFFPVFVYSVQLVESKTIFFCFMYVSGCLPLERILIG